MSHPRSNLRRARRAASRIRAGDPLTEEEYALLRHVADRVGYTLEVPVTVTDEGNVQEEGGESGHPGTAALYREDRIERERLDVPGEFIEDGGCAHPQKIVMIQHWPWKRVVETVGATWVWEEYERYRMHDRQAWIAERDEARRQLGAAWGRLRRHFEWGRRILNVMSNEVTLARTDPSDRSSERIANRFNYNVEIVWDHLVRGEPWKNLLHRLAGAAGRAIVDLRRVYGEQYDEACDALQVIMRAQVMGLRRHVRNRDLELKREHTMQSVLRWLLATDLLYGRSTVEAKDLPWQPAVEGDWLGAALERGEKDAASMPAEATLPAEKLGKDRLRKILSDPETRYRRAWVVYYEYGGKGITWDEAHAQYLQECELAGIDDPPHETGRHLARAISEWARRHEAPWKKR